MWANPGASSKPVIGSFEKCAKCNKQFTVTKYTITAADASGSLCHPCAKSSGTDPFKKPAVRKRKQPTEKRKVVYFEEKRFPTLVSVCIDIVSEHIDDIEAFGDIGAMNMEAISKAIAKNRRLTPDNAYLFYGAQNSLLTFYDATKLATPSLITLGQLNPNLTSLRLDFCGQISDDVINSWKSTLPNITSLELLGPFLVRAPAWISFFGEHKPLESFLITQSPRFNVDCMKALATNSATTLQRLGLKEIGHMCDEFLEYIGECKSLFYLDISEPTDSCTDIAVNTLLSKIGPRLTKLNLSNHSLLTDAVLDSGVGESTHQLSELALSAIPLLTDKGMSHFFTTWNNCPLSYINVSRNPSLLSGTLSSLLHHSRSRLQVLDINGLKDLEPSALKEIAKCPDLNLIDLGWCRGVDDFVMKCVLEGCTKLQEVRVWGCNKVEGKWASTGVRSPAQVIGVESQTIN
ncbi:RNI-like protein [Marasmius fiardii PR-910]|nr:RNI-like protein [Marasmius fiardii PR-910]